MKAIVALSILLLAGCQSRTDYGKCVGMGEKQDPAKTYKLSIRNLIVGIVFIETVVPPVVVAVNETYCPVAPQ